jgi:hypothetical protein
LIFSVFKPINSVSLNINCISQFLYLQFFAIVLNQSFFFILLDNCKIICCHLIFKFKLLYLGL